MVSIQRVLGLALFASALASLHSVAAQSPPVDTVATQNETQAPVDASSSASSHASMPKVSVVNRPLAIIDSESSFTASCKVCSHALAELVQTDPEAKLELSLISLPTESGVDQTPGAESTTTDKEAALQSWGSASVSLQRVQQQQETEVSFIVTQQLQMNAAASNGNNAASTAPANTSDASPEHQLMIQCRIVGGDSQPIANATDRRSVQLEDAEGQPIPFHPKAQGADAQSPSADAQASAADAVEKSPEAEVVDDAVPRKAVELPQEATPEQTESAPAAVVNSVDSFQDDFASSEGFRHHQLRAAEKQSSQQNEDQDQETNQQEPSQQKSLAQFEKVLQQLLDSRARSTLQRVTEPVPEVVEPFHPEASIEDKLAVTPEEEEPKQQPAAGVFGGSDQDADHHRHHKAKKHHKVNHHHKKHHIKKHHKKHARHATKAKQTPWAFVGEQSPIAQPEAEDEQIVAAHIGPESDAPLLVAVTPVAKSETTKPEEEIVTARVFGGSDHDSADHEPSASPEQSSKPQDEIVTARVFGGSDHDAADHETTKSTETPAATEEEKPAPYQIAGVFGGASKTGEATEEQKQQAKAFISQAKARRDASDSNATAPVSDAAAPANDAPLNLVQRMIEGLVKLFSGGRQNANVTVEEVSKPEHEEQPSDSDELRTAVISPERDADDNKVDDQSTPVQPQEDDESSPVQQIILISSSDDEDAGATPLAVRRLSPLMSSRLQNAQEQDKQQLAQRLSEAAMQRLQSQIIRQRMMQMQQNNNKAPQSQQDREDQSSAPSFPGFAFARFNSADDEVNQDGETMSNQVDFDEDVDAAESNSLPDSLSTPLPQMLLNRKNDWAAYNSEVDTDAAALDSAAMTPKIEPTDAQWTLVSTSFVVGMITAVLLALFAAIVYRVTQYIATREMNKQVQKLASGEAQVKQAEVQAMV